MQANLESVLVGLH